MAAIEDARKRWSQWPKQRERAVQRDGSVCQECGTLVGPRDSDLPTAEVHHMIPVRSDGSDDLSNLRTLCSDCHDWVDDTRAAVYPSIGDSYRRIVMRNQTSQGDEDDVERVNSGWFSVAVERDTIEAYLVEHRGASTGELADAFDVSTDTVRRRCSEPVDQGVVRAREAGRTTFWQPVE